MANITAVIEQIIMLFCITATGLFLRRRMIMTDPVIKGVNTLLLQVAWPCMILMTTQKTCTTEIVNNFLLVVFVTVIVLAAMCLIIQAAVKHYAPKVSSSVFTVLSVLPNAGFVGMPIIKAVYGDTGILYLAAFLIGFNLVTWTIGVFLFNGVSIHSLRSVLNPGFISAIIGTALFLLHIALPTPLLSMVTQLGSLTTPLSMLLLGSRLEQVSLPLLRKPRVWIASGVKLLVLPLATFFLMRVLHMDATLTGITVMSMAMPAASVAQMLAEKHNDDIQLAVAGVSVTMLLCIISIPLILFVIM